MHSCVCVFVCFWVRGGGQGGGREGGKWVEGQYLPPDFDGVEAHAKGTPHSGLQPSVLNSSCPNQTEFQAIFVTLPADFGAMDGSKSTV